MLDAFVDIMTDYEAQVAGADLSGFLMASDRGKKKRTPNPYQRHSSRCRQLLTIHSAKGWNGGFGP